MESAVSVIDTLVIFNAEGGKNLLLQCGGNSTTSYFVFMFGERD